MRFNLHLTYCGLLLITLISSCFLFIVVASENAKYVAAATVAAAENTNSAAGATLAADNVATNAPLNVDAQEEVLPNYKKVKKLKIEDAATPTVPMPPTAAAEAPSVLSRLDADAANDAGENVAAVPQHPTMDRISDAVVIPIDENGVGGMLSEVPKLEQNEPVLEVEQQVLDASIDKQDEPENSLPDITDIPTVVELPLELLEPMHSSSLEAIIIDGSNDPTQERENRTVDILENSNEAIQKDEQIIKINDSGGGNAQIAIDGIEMPSKIQENIPNENVTTNGFDAAATNEQQNASSTADTTGGSGENANVNLTAAEEVPIPVFSEWAQKQMEAAEKQQAKEQEQQVVNTAAQKKNNTNGGGKPPPLKIRAKNYASPDCGAKIIASNADASNTGAVLSSSKDEYMLSPCGNRIWFVVELCEAIQAQKIDLANFELFSSSPKNFTVAVSNRFPTRDWSNVGRFIADDKRNVQSFELHPHLFGKFVRVDIHSHYSKEHFCPLSLFRVFGTSEFEAFETENHPNDDLDDFDEEFALDQAHVKNAEPNLFKSASDAVLSIVKKAAEVLVKPSSSQNNTLATQAQAHACHTPVTGQFSCAECNNTLVERINNALSCEFQQLQQLLSIQRLRRDILSTQVCAKRYGIDTKMPAPEADCGEAAKLLHNSVEMDIKQSYFLNILPVEYIGALCQLLLDSNSQTNIRNISVSHDNDDSAELALNLTIDKKINTGDFNINESTSKKLIKSENMETLNDAKAAAVNEAQNAQIDATTTSTTSSTERAAVEDEQMQRSSEATPNIQDTTTSTTSSVPPTETTKEPIADVNIFNVPDDEIRQEPVETISSEAINNEGSGEQIPMTTIVPPTASTEATGLNTKSEEDPSTWDTLDNLLTSTVASVTSDNAVPQAGINLQQRIPNGPQSESVFIRLSNRIKALERNMSLSGQYLEELSRRYKKQVEELQQTLTQQTQTVRTLEEQNRRHSELEQLFAQRNAQLKDELDDLTLQVQACIVVIIFVGAFVFLVLIVAILFYRSLRRETKELLALHTIGSGGGKRKTITSAAANQKKLNRRKSFEDFSDHQQTLSKSCAAGGGGGEKQRRPSEEAMLILKECVGDALENVSDSNAYCGGVKSGQPRQRKISICYGSNNNLNKNKVNSARRKGEKHSWPNSEHSQQQAWQHLEQLQATDCAAEEYDKFVDADTLSHQQPKSKANNNLPNGGGNKSKKKSSQMNLKRQESAPTEFPANAYETRLNVTAPGNLENAGGDYDEDLILDEDDLDNFLPNADLAYNEFMPDGPSGYQIVGGVANAKNSTEKPLSKKGRRLSSPAFFKSPFGKSFKAKATAAVSLKTNPQHESTSWEWYRLKKSEAQQQNKQHLHTSTSASGGFLLRDSPITSLDSSSLSEIHFPTNSTENSFRILEEAILSSGEGVTTTAASNGNGHSLSSGSSSNRSSTSTSSSKKKNRSFNKIFRKVF